MTKPDLSIVIVSYNTRDLLLKCLKSVFRSAGAGGLEVFVVDNGSSDGSREAVRQEYPQVTLLSASRNIGFARASNLALRQTQGRYFVLLNSDTELRKDALAVMQKFLDGALDADVVGPRLVYEDGSTQPSADYFPNLLSEFLHLCQVGRFLPGERMRQRLAPFLSRVSRKTVGTYFQAYSHDKHPRPVDCLSGACLMGRRELIDEVGLLDDRFFMYMEDIDWCIRARKAGRQAYYLPEVEVIHHVGQSRSQNPAVEETTFVEHYKSRLYFFKKHRGRVARLLVRLMMVCVFSARWLFTCLYLLSPGRRVEARARRKMYARVLRVTLS